MKLELEGSENKETLLTDDPNDRDYISDEYLSALEDRGQLLKDMIVTWRSMLVVLTTRSRNRAQSRKSMVKFSPGEGQGKVLMCLGNGDGVSQARLAREVGVTPQTLTTHLRKLEEQGLVRREKSAEDGRALCVFLTPKGRKALYALEEEEKYSGSMFEVFTTEELVQLNYLIGKLDKRLRDEIQVSSSVDALINRE